VREGEREGERERERERDVYYWAVDLLKRHSGIVWVRGISLRARHKEVGEPFLLRYAKAENNVESSRKATRSEGDNLEESATRAHLPLGERTWWEM